MSQALYPTDLPGLKWPVQRTPVWNTQLFTTPSGREFATTSMAFPRQRFTLQYEFLRSAGAFGEYQRLFDFFNARSGRYDSFLFCDRDDCYVQLQHLAIGTGSTTQYQLGRSLVDTPHNLQADSEGLSSNWTRSGGIGISAASGVLSPRGDLTALRVDTTTGTSAYVSPGLNGFARAGRILTFSLHVKAGSGVTRVYHEFSQGNGTTTFDLTTLVASVSGGGSAGIVDVGDGWLRLWVTRTVPPANYSFFRAWYFQAMGNATATAYCYVWGAQINYGGLIPYVPSAGSPALPNLEPVFDLAGAPQIIMRDWQVDFDRLYPTARTNMLLQSQALDSGSWGKVNASLTANASVAPDGTTTAEKMVQSSASQGYVYQAVTIVSGLTYTFSIYAKQGEYRYLQLSGDAISGRIGSNAYFDLQAGVVMGASVGTAAIYPVGNGWFRCVVTGTSNNTGAQPYARPSADGATPAPGDGTSGVYLWGAQLEVGTATRYIPTTTAAVTITDYTISSTGLLTLAVAPLSGAQLLWTGSYYWRVRFDADDMPFDQFMRQFWQTGQVKLITRKP